MSDEQEHIDLAAVARGLRAVLEELDDPASELTAHRGVRSRLEGAVLAIEAMAAGSDPHHGHP